MDGRARILKEAVIIMVVDETKLHEFIGKVVNEWGAAEGALITFIGDRLGLFKAMAGAGGMTSDELAKKDWNTSTNNKRMACRTSSRRIYCL